MLLEIDVMLALRLGPSRHALLAVEVARQPGQEVQHERLVVDGARVARVAGEGGVGTRQWLEAEADDLHVAYRAVVAVTRPRTDLAALRGVAMHALPADALTYLRPSRFCQSDEFAGFAGNRFGHLEGGARVAAIRDWVATEIAYLQASSHPGTTVLDTFARREGVCRDFAHMVCALVRAAGIPARYAAAYGLGVTPEDFHAVAEVWLEDSWHVVDATGMCAADGLALIGVGRDACDAPFLETEDLSEVRAQAVTVRRREG